MPDLLIEIGVEEIPAGFATSGRENFERLLREKLADFVSDKTSFEIVGTPRRLSAMVFDLRESSAAREEEQKGPPERAAFDAHGNPTKAALGFASRLGLKPEELLRRNGYLYGSLKIPGRAVREVLVDALPGVFKEMPWPKSMRWNDSGARFVRAIRWIVALLDGKVLPFSYGGTTAGRTSFRRAMPSGGDASEEISVGFEITDAPSYRETLKNHGIVVDQNDRAQLIRDEIAQRSAGLGADPVLPLGERTALYLADHVEAPIVLLGEFDPSLAEAPREVLELTMWLHQKYVPLVKDGRLLPRFVITANRMFEGSGSAASYERNVLAGNRRVLSARLSDARYFWDEDCRVPLEDRIDALRRVTFQKDAGSIHDRVERIEGLALAIGPALGQTDERKIRRAARLAKADLTTKMVFEFPELQGVIGRRLAEAQGEDPVIANAIEEHYCPKGADDRLPEGLGAVIALADKSDLLSTIFAVGLEPTGSADPFGLRRAAIGLIRILAEIGEGFDVRRLAPDPKVLEFIRGRLLHFALERASTRNTQRRDGVHAGIVEAVMASGWHDIPDFLRRFEAASRLPERSDFEDLKTSFKRVMNILEDDEAPADLDEKLLNAPAERDLYNATVELASRVDRSLRARNIDDALSAMASVRPTVDRFFDEVLVNDPDEALQKNRKALLRAPARTFLRLMDFSKL